MVPALYLELLKDFLSYKSVSTDPKYRDEINKTVEWLENVFEGHGFTVKIVEGYDNPIVLANYFVGDDKETCLIYGHYDVQPADEENGWDSEPFALRVNEERLYGRGVVDNKGQVLIHIATAIELIKEGKLNYNLKFFLEGNEETGSAHLENFVKDFEDELSADFALISDGEITGESPTIDAGFRGGFNSILTIKTANTDLHSGIFGGAAPNATQEMSELISKIYDNDNKVTVDGFYDDVDEISKDILENNSRITFSLEELTKSTGIKDIKKEENLDFYSQTGLRPAIVVTGIDGGYTGEGFKNILVAECSAKINFRLVKNQEPYKIEMLFRKFLEENIPDYVDYSFKAQDHYEGVKVDLKNKFVTKATKVLEKAFGEKVIFLYSGGGLPIVTLLQEELKIPTVSACLGNEDCEK